VAIAACRCETPPEHPRTSQEVTMKRTVKNRHDAERIVPLLRSIGAEIRERSRAVDALEDRLANFSATRDERREEIRRLESELSLHRREMRRIERELAELGCNLDADHPLRILIPSKGGTYAYERLDKTSFYRRPEAAQH
jgi:predicted RNase H-like nuclease (RuvC/YqgF family)